MTLTQDDHWTDSALIPLYALIGLVLLWRWRKKR